MDEDEAAAIIAQKLDEWIEDERRERRDQEWWPDVDYIFTAAREKFDQGEY